MAAAGKERGEERREEGERRGRGEGERAEVFDLQALQENKTSRVLNRCANVRLL